MSRAREPDHVGSVEREGQHVGYEIHGDGPDTSRETEFERL